eukprot:jgi/Ulvmu1/9441/UM052_0005.1
MGSDRPTRRRKAPGKFEGTYSSFSSGQDFAAAKGDGTPVRNIGSVVRRLNALHDGAPEMKLLYSAIYGHEGSPNSRKQQLLDFQGLKGESAAANDNIRKRAVKILNEYKDTAVVAGLAEVLGFVTTNVQPKKLVPKICNFLLQPDPALCEADTAEAAAAADGDAEETPHADPKPAKSARKRKSAPAQPGRKAKAQRGRRGASAGQAASAKEESALQTASEITHSEAGVSETRAAEATEQTDTVAPDPAPSAAVSADEAALPSAGPPSEAANEPIEAPVATEDNKLPMPATEAGTAEADVDVEMEQHAYEDMDAEVNGGQTELAPADLAVPELELSADVPMQSVAPAAQADPAQRGRAGAETAVSAPAPVASPDARDAIMSREMAGPDLLAEPAAGLLGFGPGDQDQSASEAASDSPDEAPLAPANVVAPQQPGGAGAVPVAGVPQVAPHGDADAPAVAIPVDGAHVAADVAADGAEAVTAAADDHVAEPPDAHMHDVVMADHVPEAAAAAAHDAPAPAAAAVQAPPQAAAKIVELPGAAGKAPATGVARSQPARARRPRAMAVQEAQPVAAAAAAPDHSSRITDAAAAMVQPVAPAEGVRTRGRGAAREKQGKGGSAPDQSNDIRECVLQLLQEFDHPETTLVRDLRVALEDKFGIKVAMFNQWMPDVVQACGDFFTDLGIADSS